jgi:hypothetical protein
MLLFSFIACMSSGSIPIGSGEIETTSTLPATTQTNTIETTTVTTVPTETGTTVTSTTTTTSTFFQDVQISVHPEISAILLVSWEQDEASEASWIEYSFNDTNLDSTPVKVRAEGTHEQALFGIPTETEVSVQLFQETGGVLSSSPILTATTGSLPNALRRAFVNVLEPTGLSPERFMLGTMSAGTSSSGYGGPCWVFIMNREGEFVWFWEVPDSRLSMFAQVAASGDHIVFDGTTYYVWDNNVEPQIWRATLDLSYFDATEIEEFGFSMDEIEGGNILYNDYTGDHRLIEMDPDGNKREIFNCEDLYSDSICTLNGVVYNSATDTIFWSMYSSDTVIEVERSTGSIVKQFGQLSGGWDFDPPNSVVDYQHYPTTAPNGNIVASTHTVGESNTQRASEWRVDTATETLVEVWRYDGSPYYAEYGGEAYRLANDNTLIGFGTDGAVQEVTLGKEVVWDVNFDGGPLMGHFSLVDDLYALNGER